MADPVFEVTTCCHGTPALEFRDASEELHGFLRAILTNQRMDTEYPADRFHNGDIMDPVYIDPNHGSGFFKAGTIFDVFKFPLLKLHLVVFEDRNPGPFHDPFSDMHRCTRSQAGFSDPSGQQASHDPPLG